MFNVLKNQKAWNWSERCHNVFDQLKKRFCTASILKHFDPTLETILQTDTSDYVVSGILSQKHLVNAKLVLYAVAYLSEKISPAQCTYSVDNNEILAIVPSLEKWPIYLHPLPKAFTICANHHDLQTISTKDLFNQLQVR